jgi:hypothetical protein
VPGYGDRSEDTVLQLRDPEDNSEWAPSPQRIMRAAASAAGTGGDQDVQQASAASCLMKRPASAAETPPQRQLFFVQPSGTRSLASFAGGSYSRRCLGRKDSCGPDNVEFNISVWVWGIEKQEPVLPDPLIDILCPSSRLFFTGSEGGAASATPDLLRAIEVQTEWEMSAGGGLVDGCLSRTEKKPTHNLFSWGDCAFLGVKTIGEVAVSYSQQSLPTDPLNILLLTRQQSVELKAKGAKARQTAETRRRQDGVDSVTTSRSSAVSAQVAETTATFAHLNLVSNGLCASAAAAGGGQSSSSASAGVQQL